MRSTRVVLSKSFFGSPLQTVIWLWYCCMCPRTICIGKNKAWCSSNVQVADSSLVSHSPSPTFRQWMNDSECISWCSVHLDYQRMADLGIQSWLNSKGRQIRTEETKPTTKEIGANQIDNAWFPEWVMDAIVGVFPSMHVVCLSLTCFDW